MDEVEYIKRTKTRRELLWADLMTHIPSIKKTDKVYVKIEGVDKEYLVGISCQLIVETTAEEVMSADDMYDHLERENEWQMPTDEE